MTADNWLTGRGELDGAGAGRALGTAAAAIAKALRRNEADSDPDLDGPPLSSADADAAAIEARFLLETIAALFGASDYLVDDLAFVGRFAKRQGFKPVMAPGPGAMRRLYAASRVHELMAQDAARREHGAKQEAAVQQVMKETGLPRSKVMQGLKEQRQRLAGWFAFAPGGQPVSECEAIERAKAALIGCAIDRMGISPPETPD